MYKFLRKIKGQSSVEYAVLIIVIIGALLAIQVYIKRGIKGRLKSATDDIGDQYSPGNTNVYTTMHTKSTTLDTFEKGATKSTLQTREEVTEGVLTNIVNVDREFWGTK